MSIREWTYQKLANCEPLLAVIPEDHMYSGESMFQAPQRKPFLILRFGNTSPDNEVRQARRQYFTVYLHDDADPGDYTQIDAIEDIVKLLFEDEYDRENRIVNVRWLETSADFDDREMSTILRYLRFQIVTATWHT